MKNIINSLDKMIVYINKNYLYAINKHHTLMLKFRLKKEYPEMCFSTNKWEMDSEFEKIRDKHILFRNGNELIKIPSLDINLKKEFDELASKCKKKVFTISDPIFKLIQRYTGSSSFFKLSVNKNKTQVSLYDTSKDQSIESMFQMFSAGGNGTWFLPTSEINTLYKLGFTCPEVKESDDKNYFLLEGRNQAIVSSMKVTT